MPRPINKQCQACALESIAEARSQTCWVEKTCKSRRNNYRRRPQTLPKRREVYATSVGKPIAQKVELSPGGHWCELVLYGNPPSKQGVVNGGSSQLLVK